MPNQNLIKLKQIDSALGDFIAQISSGVFDKHLADYVSTGYLGSNIVYSSGGNQNIFGTKNFNSPITIPYSGANNQSVNKQYVLDRVNELPFSSILHTTGNENVLGLKNFTTSPIVGFPTGRLQTVQYGQLIDSGNFLQMQVDAVTVGNSTTGFGGVLSFNGQSGNLFALGKGNITVTQKDRLTYISGNTAVLSGSGVYLIQGEQGPMGLNLNPRGNWATNRNYDFLDFVSSSGNAYVSITGHLSTFDNQPGTGAFVSPWRFLVSGGNPGPIGPTGAWKHRGSFVPENIYKLNDSAYYNGSSYGFGGTSSVGLFPTTGAGWYLIAQSGTRGLQGAGAAIFNWKGNWLATGNYISGDAVYYNGSTFAIQKNASGFIPNTGEPWFILSSGSIGLTGAWQYKGAYDSGLNYYFNNAVQYGGSTYGFSGTTTLNVAPTMGGGWYLISSSGAQGLPGAIGSFINSGIITGNFLSFSFYQDFFYTGLNLFETFVPRNFSITGFAIGCIKSGRGPSLLNSGFSGVPIFTPLTGNVYKRDSSNTKTFLGGFSFNSGVIYQIQPMSALVNNCPTRIGIDIFSGLSGISQITYGIFGL